ncbi:MAG: BON domain-containing protein [Rhodospirillaceae bacterium]
MTRRFRILHSLCVAVLPALSLAGCSQPTGLLNVATSPAEDRSMASLSSDAQIALDINERLLGAQYRDLFFEISTDVYEGRVLLTGTVRAAASKDRATELVRSVNSVTRVINELQVTDDYNTGIAANDLWIETKLKAQLVAARDVRSINYRWRAVRGTVYLIGAARSQAELDRVVEIVRATERVRRVVSHAWVRSAQPQG